MTNLQYSFLCPVSVLSIPSLLHFSQINSNHTTLFTHNVPCSLVHFFAYTGRRRKEATNKTARNRNIPVRKFVYVLKPFKLLESFRLFNVISGISSYSCFSVCFQSRFIYVLTKQLMSAIIFVLYAF